MSKGFYTKIAADNVKKNYRLYVPRILAEAGLFASFYILFTLALDKRLGEAVGGSGLPTLMGMGTFIIGFLSLILILYVNSFLMKQRKREYGLYNVLGMEKRHIVKVLFFESLIASAVSIAIGVVFGMLFYKLSSLLICRLLRSEAVPGFYYLSAPTVLFPMLVFVGLDLLAFLAGAVSILRLKPVELLSGARTGEKEPRTRWALLVLGVLSLGAGYYISLTVKSPLAALFLFFAAVLLVMVGTYFLYVSGSAFVLKTLKKNKRFYYDPKHMPAVSGLLFRMKKNAVGLASIAILATGVLVMISTTVSLYGGVKGTMETNYPQQLYLSAFINDNDRTKRVPVEDLKAIVSETAEEMSVEIDHVDSEKLLIVSYQMRDNRLLTMKETDGWKAEEITNVIYITEDTYKNIRGVASVISEPKGLGLKKDEIAFCRISTMMNDVGSQPGSITINAREYRIKEHLAYFPIASNTSGIVSVVGIVVSDDDVLNDIYTAQKEAYGEHASEFADRIGVTFADEAAVSSVGADFDRIVGEKLKARYPDGLSYELDTKWESLKNVLELYGTFLFLGMLLGAVCLFATILIIYYKQISEGYEDRRRFQIMQKIGMEERAVKRTIGSQLVMQFFLPLITAGIHTAFAFPILLKLLKMLMLTNTALFVVCSLAAFAVFALVYAAVYLLTARTYYRIVH